VKPELSSVQLRTSTENLQGIPTQIVANIKQVSVSLMTGICLNAI